MLMLISYMPALSGIEEKYFEGYKIDKENDTVVYSDEKHVYIDKKSKERCISVTTLISQYHAEFDEEFWSLYKAIEALMGLENFESIKPILLANKKADMKLIKKLDLGLSEEDIINKQLEIKESYRVNREAACQRGTAIHAQFENSFYGKKNFDFKNYGFAEISGDYTCHKDYYTLDLSKGVYPEFLMSVSSSDGVLRLAGQVDLLIINGSDAYIVDFKSNKKLDKSSYYDKKKKSHNMMKFPVSHLQDCNFNHYQLQLSIYAYMLQTLRPDINIKKLILYHIDHDNNETLHECTYLKEDVIKLLNHYKKKLKVQLALDRDKPVIIG